MFREERQTKATYWALVGGYYMTQPGNPGVWPQRWETCCCRGKWRQTWRPRSAGISPFSALLSIFERPARRKSASACTVCKRCFSSSLRRESRLGHIFSWARFSTITPRTASWPATTWRKRWGTLGPGKSGDAAETGDECRPRAEKTGSCPADKSWNHGE